MWYLKFRARIWLHCGYKSFINTFFYQIGIQSKYSVLYRCPNWSYIIIHVHSDIFNAIRYQLWANYITQMYAVNYEKLFHLAALPESTFYSSTSKSASSVDWSNILIEKQQSCRPYMAYLKNTDLVIWSSRILSWKIALASAIAGQPLITFSRPVVTTSFYLFCFPPNSCISGALVQTVWNGMDY